MVRLTAELIVTSPAFINPLKERELDLRGNKIPQIENLGATEDQYDVIDLSDNDLGKLENFPVLTRLKSLFLSNNRIAHISSGLGEKLPHLETLVLINNRLESLADLDALFEFRKLHTLALLKNSVANKEQYRLYVIARLPKLKVLDFRKVGQKEKDEAKRLFGGKVSEAQSKAAAQTTGAAVARGGLTDEDKQRIKDAIARAETMEEVQKLERMLQSGKLPKHLSDPMDVK